MASFNLPIYLSPPKYSPSNTNTPSKIKLSPSNPTGFSSFSANPKEQNWALNVNAPLHDYQFFDADEIEEQLRKNRLVLERKDEEDKKKLGVDGAKNCGQTGKDLIEKMGVDRAKNGRQTGKGCLIEKELSKLIKEDPTNN